MDYQKKYLKYKKKYLLLNNQIGGLLNAEQILFHNFLKNMKSDTFVSGFSGIYQWYNNDPNSKMPRSVTIIGEYHEDYNIFGTCHVKTTMTGPVQPQQNITVIELLYNMFKGTRTCVDFYLEDWLQQANIALRQVANPFDIRTRNWTPANISPPINPTRPGLDYSQFTIQNLVAMTNTDIVPPGRGILRRDTKKFDNVRLHSTEFRLARRNHIILPYSISQGLWLSFKDRALSGLILNRLIQPANLQPYLRRIRDFMYLLAGINPDATIGNNKYFIDNNDMPRMETLFDDIYYDILINHYALGPHGIRQYINLDRTITRRNNDVGIEINFERQTLKRYMTKNVHNIKKFDTETLDKYLTFFIAYLNYDTIITNINNLHPELIIDNVILLRLLEYITTSIVDIYTISRSLKIFGLQNQSNNLKVNSLCFNEFGPSNRNLVYYHGYLHTAMHYIFWRHFFNRISDYSIKTRNYPGGFTYHDFNFYYNNRFFSPIGGRVQHEIDINTDFNILAMTIKHHYLHAVFNIRANPNIEILYNNKYYVDDNNVVTNDTTQCVGNMDNVLKKILINITKNSNERIKLYDQINNTYIEKQMKNDCISMLKTVVQSNFRLYDYRNILSTNFVNYNRQQILSTPIDFVTVYNDSLYTKRDFENHMRNNNFPPLVVNTLQNDKRELESIATSYFSNYFLKDDITRLKFVEFVINIYTTTIDEWLHRRLNNIIDTNRNAFGLLPLDPITPDMIDKYKNIKRDSLIKIIYKGGMPIKILYTQLKKQFTIEIENFIDEQYGGIFSLSDNDFSLIINTPDIHENGITAVVRADRVRLFNEVYNEISLLNFVIIREITNIFNDPTKQVLIFDFFKTSKSYQRTSLQFLFKNINKKVQLKIATGKPYTFTTLTNNNFDMIQAYDDVVYPAENFDLIDNTYNNMQTNDPGSNPNNNNRKNFIIMDNIVPKPDNNANVIAYYANINARPFVLPPVINPNEQIVVKNVYNAELILDNIGIKLYNKTRNGPFYCSYNTIIKTDFSIFTLSRIKFNFRLFGHNAGNNIFLNIPGEVLDMTIGNLTEKILKHTNIYQSYTVKQNKSSLLKYNSLSLGGFIQDLLEVLFIYSKPDIIPTGINVYGLPWFGSKYQKRLSRTLFLTFIDSYDNTITGSNKNMSIDNIKLFYSSLIRLFNHNNLIATGARLVQIEQAKLLNFINDLLDLIKTDVNNSGDANLIRDTIPLLDNDLILVLTQKAVPLNGLVNTPNIDEYDVIDKLRNYNGLIAFLYCIVKSIIFYKLTNAGNPAITALWNDNDFIEFVKTLNKKLLLLRKLIYMIEKTTTLKLGKRLYDVDLQSV